jgi:hypothetical protein
MTGMDELFLGVFMERLVFSPDNVQMVIKKKRGFLETFSKSWGVLKKTKFFFGDVYKFLIFLISMISLPPV